MPRCTGGDPLTGAHRRYLRDGTPRKQSPACGSAGPQAAAPLVGGCSGEADVPLSRHTHAVAPAGLRFPFNSATPGRAPSSRPNFACQNWG